MRRFLFILRQMFPNDVLALFLITLLVCGLFAASLPGCPLSHDNLEPIPGGFHVPSK